MVSQETHGVGLQGPPGRRSAGAPVLRAGCRQARGLAIPLWSLTLPLLLVLTCGAYGYDAQTPDVVLIVDTSESMTKPGMDPERTSLLVSKLFADILPGNLAVVRLLDLRADQAVLPHTEVPGSSHPCAEGEGEGGGAGGGICSRVEQVGDWGELARANLLGVLKRERPGDQTFKNGLADHLTQKSKNSDFYLSFRAAQGVFERNAANGQASDNRTVIWLSDGDDKNEGALTEALADLRDTRIVSLIFGSGSLAIPQRLHHTPVRVSSSAELMGAFAQAFRQIMRAPYRVDHRVAETPEFAVRPNIETLWVVVYGDTSLTGVTLRGADGQTHTADAAADSLPRAGAYRVARIESPAAGTWRVETSGGGAGRAYAVIQRSALGPRLLGPAQAQADLETRLIAAVTAGTDPTPVTDREALENASLTATIDGEQVTFKDDGRGADERAGDGHFSALHRFRTAGSQSFDLTLASPFAQRQVHASIEVSGVFRYTGPDLDLRFGTLQAPTAACQPVTLNSAAGILEHRGTIPFALEATGGLPAGHRLSVRIGDQRLVPGGTAEWPAAAPLEACLEVDASAPSSMADGNHDLFLHVRGSQAREQGLHLRLYWEVQGLSFRQRWGWLVLLGLAALVAIFIALGFILPKRFSPTLAIGFGPERDDLDEYPPQSIRNWRGVGIGFYRNARAFLHPDFRLTGRSQGALAGLYALGAPTRVQAQRGMTLYREDLVSGWTPLPPTGEVARPGEVYRVGDSGPFFRLSAR